MPLILSAVKSESKKEQTDFDTEDKIAFSDDFEPPGDDKPKDTGAGGSRDGAKCNTEEQPIRAIMPKGNHGLTSKPQPNIYLHLPQTSAKQVVLAIQDEAGTEYARVFLPIETNSNIASFSLPQNKMTLQAGKNYQWKISVVCNEYLKPGDPIFTGWVQRVKSLSRDKQIVSDVNREQINFLGERGYWYDLLDVIANNATSPDNWQQVLEYIDY